MNGTSMVPSFAPTFGSARHGVGDWTEALARLFGERTALVCATTGERVDYRALAQRTQATARALAAQGVVAGDRVVVLAKNRIDHVALMFACARLGALFVPLNWRLAEPELAFIVDDIEPRVLVFDRAHAYVTGRLSSTRAFTAVPLDEEEGPDARATLATLAARPGPIPRQHPTNDDDAWIVLYTSGTTGAPKGALLPYRQVSANAFNTIVAVQLSSDDKTITYTPFFHTGALHVLTTPLLAVGGCVVLTDGFDAGRLLALTAAERTTILFGVPTTFEMMADHASFATLDLSSVRVALCGGAPCPLSLIERYTTRGLVFKQGYGLTEVGPNVLNLRGEDVVRKRGSAGQPNLLVAAEIRDEDGRIVDGPGKGELVLGGPCVCKGYWRRPDATAAAFTEDGMFRTGDVVLRDADGFYTIVDRKKDMFISGGENVYPAEIEKALADHPDVKLAAVVGVTDDKWGEVGRAFLELRTGARLDEPALKTWLRTRLAAYKVPKELVVLDELPKNASGKVQKHLLSRALAN